MSEHQIQCRPGTYDANIWQSVAGNNEYGLPEKFSADDVILDVGGHIGSFAYACLDRGAGCVVSVEPDTDNAHYYRHNLHSACRAEGRSVLITAAAWRSDRLVDVVRYAGVGTNTGGGNTLGEDGHPVRAISLDALVVLAAGLSPRGRVRLVKFDCEGAEWPCLLTMTRWDLVDAMVGEFHTIREPAGWPAAALPDSAPWTALVLERLFDWRGWGCSVERSDSLGKFRAWRSEDVRL